MKRCTFIQSGEKVYILCVLYMSVEIWLDSAPFKEVCAMSKTHEKSEPRRPIGVQLRGSGYHTPPMCMNVQGPVQCCLQL